MVEIKVENEFLDLFPSETISLSFAINDLAAIESRNGNFSNKFDIPASKKNSKILGYANVLNFSTGFKPTKSRNASILIDGLTVERGVVQVEQFNFKVNTFSISFLGGNTEWIDDIGDKNLVDLDLTNLNHEYTLANITNSFNNTEGYIYPFIQYGRFNNRTSNNTDLEDWKPGIFFSTLLKQIFIDADWKLSGSFLNDTLYNRLILPFSIQKETFGKEFLNGVGVDAVTTVNNILGNTTVVWDDVKEGNDFDVYDNTTGEYTVDRSVKIIIKSLIDLPGLVSLTQIRVNGIVVASSLNTVGYNYSASIGDVITVTANTAGIVDQNKSFFNVSVVDRITEGVEWDMSATLPDVSQSDFVKNIFNQFGCIFSADKISKTVYVNKFEEVKNNISNALDWTEKLDKSREIEVDYVELSSDYAKKNNYKYNENRDSESASNMLTPIVEVSNFNIGDGDFEIDNDFIEKEKDIFDSPFSASTTIPAFNSRVNMLYIPRYTDAGVDVKNPDVDPGARVCVNAGLISVDELFDGAETSIDIQGKNNTSNVTEVPYPYFHLGRTGITQIDSLGQGLSFGDPITPKFQLNLIDEYYGDYISILNNPRRVTAFFNLNERDINNLDFLIPIYIGGDLNSYFYINKISDYRPSENGVTKVELVLIV